MELILLPFTRDHLDAVLEVEQNAMPHPWSRSQFLGDLTSPLGRYFVALADGRVVGYAGALLILDEVHISNIAVHSDYHRRGIADRLLTRLEEQTQTEGANFYTLEVRRKNTAAQALYQKHGFTVAGERKNYYGDDDALIMIKEW